MNDVKKRRGRPKMHKDVPSHLTCIVTKKKVKTTKDQFYKQLERSGLSNDIFCRTYISREGKKLLKHMESLLDLENIPEQSRNKIQQDLSEIQRLRQEIFELDQKKLSDKTTNV